MQEKAMGDGGGPCGECGQQNGDGCGPGCCMAHSIIGGGHCVPLLPLPDMLPSDARQPSVPVLSLLFGEGYCCGYPWKPRPPCRGVWGVSTDGCTP